MFWLAVLVGAIQGVGMWLFEAVQQREDAPEPVHRAPGDSARE